MKISITTAISYLFITVCLVLFVSVLNFCTGMQKMNDYHYATVHELESSDFASSVIAEKTADTTYHTTVVNKTLKNDNGIYEVKTTKTFSIPILNYTQEYSKVSVVR